MIYKWRSADNTAPKSMRYLSHKIWCCIAT